MSPASPDDDSSAEVDEPPRRLLLVSVGDGIVGLRAELVIEVITAREYASIPGTAECIAGLVNRRGRILTVVDLGIAIGAASTAALPDHRIVVVSFFAKELGLAVGDVLQITDDDAPAGRQARVVELDSLLTPFFGDGSGLDEPTFEKS